MLSPKIDLAAIDAQLQLHRVPDPRRGIRFNFLIAFAHRYTEANALTPEEQQAFVACLDERMGDWLPEERKAKESWWMDERWEDSVYDYGANNGGGGPNFHGFLAEPHWLMPLARAATLSNPTIVLEGEHLTAFLQSSAIGHLQILRLQLFLKPAVIAGIMDSGRFIHLHVLETPYLDALDKAQRKTFHRWRVQHGIAQE